MKIKLEIEGLQYSYTRVQKNAYERVIEAIYQRGYRAGLRSYNEQPVQPYKRVDYRDAWQHGVNDAVRKLQGKSA